MILLKWKELVEKKTKAGKMVNQLYDKITAEKIRSKTTDQAIAKTFRLDRLDQIAEQTTPKPKRRLLRPKINADGGIDNAPEVDPCEDMDVEGLLNLEDYVAPQAEKQIAKLPQNEMDPSYWQLPADPPPQNDEIEAPPEEDEGEVEGEDEGEGEEDEREANKILDHLELPNYDDVEMR